MSIAVFQIFILISWMIGCCHKNRSSKKRRPHGGKSKHVLVAGQGTPNSCTPAVKTARPNSCTPAVKTARLNTLRTSTAKPIEVAHSIAKSTGKPSEVRTKTKHEEAKEKSKKHEAKETSKAKEPMPVQPVTQHAFIPYPSVKEPSPSTKRRRAQQLAESKRQKIASGFYQPNSDEDDTLEQVVSLPMTQSEKSRMWIVKSLLSRKSDKK